MDLVDILSEVLKGCERPAPHRGLAPDHTRERHPGASRTPRLQTNDTRELIYSILSQDQRQRLENEWEIDFSYSVPGRARFRVNAYFQRNSLGAAFRLIPVEIKKLDELGLPGDAQYGDHAPRLRPRHGTHRVGQIDYAGCHHRPDQRDSRDHIMTIEDPIEFLLRPRNAWSTSARSAPTPSPSPAR